MKLHAVVPGSFDPVTAGHYDLFSAAVGMYSKVTVLLSRNDSKRTMFCEEDRLRMLKEAVRDLNNVSVESYGGLIGEYCFKNKIDIILKGVRDTRDYEYEKEMAAVNEMLSPFTRTIFLPSSPKNRFISSTMVRVFIESGRDVSEYLPKGVVIDR